MVPLKYTLHQRLCHCRIFNIVEQSVVVAAFGQAHQFYAFIMDDMHLKVTFHGKLVTEHLSQDDVVEWWRATTDRGLVKLHLAMTAITMRTH